MRRLKVALDCDISIRMAAVLGPLYGDRGFEFVHVSEFVPSDTRDEHWADAFKRFGGYISVSADRNIATKPHKALAFIDNRFIAFFMASAWSRMHGHLKAAHLAYWWPAMEATIREDKRGVCWQVPCEVKDRDLMLYEVKLRQLRIPDDVLEQARANSKPA